MHLPALMMRKYKNYKGASITIRGSQIVTMVMFNLMIKKEITNCDNGNVQSDQEESKWNSSTHTLLHNKIMKNPIKSK